MGAQGAEPPTPSLYPLCTTTIHHMHKSPKDVLENLLHVRTNFIPICFWTTYTNFDNCYLRYIATCGKKLYRCTSTFSVLNLLQWNILQISQLSIQSRAHKLFRQFLDFSKFLTAILQNLWRHLATKMRTM